MTVSFCSVLCNIQQSGVLTALFDCCMAGATKNCCRLGVSSVCTIQSCTSLQSCIIQSHIGRVHLCLAVICHLHFWQNGQDLICATAVTTDGSVDGWMDQLVDGWIV